MRRLAGLFLSESGIGHQLGKDRPFLHARTLLGVLDDGLAHASRIGAQLGELQVVVLVFGAHADVDRRGGDRGVRGGIVHTPSSRHFGEAPLNGDHWLI